VLEDVPAFASGLLTRFEAQRAGLCRQINTSGELSKETRETLMTMIADYRTAWLKG